MTDDDRPRRPARRRPRRGLVLGSIGVGLGVVLAVWLALANSLGAVTWTDTGYVVNGDRSVTVTFDVHRPAGTAVRCTVRALDKRFGAVGTKDVDIPAGAEPSVSRRVTVRTTARAVTGTVKRCEAM